MDSQESQKSQDSRESREVFFSLKNLEIGTATDENGPTGVTVFHFPRGAIGAVDERGGAVASRESSALSPDNTWGYLDALVISGGSTFGLAAIDGVMGRILEKRGGTINFSTIPAVPGAVVYDFTKRENSVYPTAELGARAFDARKAGVVEIGKVGAGTNTYIGKWFKDLTPERGAQVAAYFEEDGIKILVLSILNPVGNLIGKNGEVIRGSVAEDGSRIDIGERLLENWMEVKNLGEPSSGNTTISVVVTNLKLDRPGLQRLASMAHTSLGAVISPFHTPSDGDVLYAISTLEDEIPEGVGISRLGAIAGRLLKKAVWNIP